MSTSLDHFDDEDQKILASLGINPNGADTEDGTGNTSATDGNANADSGTTRQATGTDAGTSAQGQADANAAGAANGSDDAANTASMSNAAQDEQQAGGNVKAALRASRRAEARAKQERDAAMAELERLQKLVPGEAAGDASDADLEALAQDFPGIAKVVKAQAQQINELNQRVAGANPGASTQASADFTPPALPLDVQSVVDEIPALLDMQHNPDQSGWQLAVKYDAALRNDPDWEDASAQARFEEAARRAAAKLGPTNAPAPAAPPAARGSSPTPSPQQTAQQRAAAAAAKAATRTPESLSDFGGAATEPAGSNLGRFLRMSETQIEDELMRGG
jgi:hypothetical protein